VAGVAREDAEAVCAADVHSMPSAATRFARCRAAKGRRYPTKSDGQPIRSPARGNDPDEDRCYRDVRVPVMVAPQLVPPTMTFNRDNNPLGRAT
jgi:hypothetical protein